MSGKNKHRDDKRESNQSKSTPKDTTPQLVSANQSKRALLPYFFHRIANKANFFRGGTKKSSKSENPQPDFDYGSENPEPDFVHGVGEEDGINGLRVDDTPYRVGLCIGRGSFGQVRIARNIKTAEVLAVKMEAIDSRHPMLANEWEMYKVLTQTPAPGIPKVLHYGMCGMYNVLAMELLGPSLQQLFVNGKNKFSLHTILMIAIQLITRLEYVHSNYIVHRDIKPENLMVCQQPSRDNTIFLVDFGLSKYYVDPVTKAHKPFKFNLRVSGTSRYMSLNTHKGIQHSRRDDLETLGYVLIYFLRGSLPWQGLDAYHSKEKFQQVMALKKKYSTKELCEGHPPEFVQYMQDVRMLGFFQDPDYEHLRELFKRRLKKEGYDPHGHMDWNHKIVDKKGWWK